MLHCLIVGVFRFSCLSQGLIFCSMLFLQLPWVVSPSPTFLSVPLAFHLKRAL